MYTSRTGLTLGFHGTDEENAQAVLNGERELKPSKNSYDWLGHGIYFWDNSPSRALKWATEMSKRKGSSVKKPAVIGAVIDLGYCLDLLDYKNLTLVKEAYSTLRHSMSETGRLMPVNSGGTFDLVQRELDCAVIEMLHESFRTTSQPAFDSVRGVFWEGKELYPGAGFKEKDHIQICLRSIDCIKGYFRPLKRLMA